eukprot:7377586-Prymnesium_polylepis.1
MPDVRTVTERELVVDHVARVTVRALALPEATDEVEGVATELAKSRAKHGLRAATPQAVVEAVDHLERLAGLRQNDRGAGVEEARRHGIVPLVLTVHPASHDASPQHLDDAGVQHINAELDAVLFALEPRDRRSPCAHPSALEVASDRLIEERNCVRVCVPPHAAIVRLCVAKSWTGWLRTAICEWRSL